MASKATQFIEISVIDEQSLCIACGFCCDGTLFDNAEIAEQEQQQLFSELQLSITPFNGELAQPCCAHNSCTGCQAYQTRPKICQKYSCNMLDKVRAKELKLESAKEKILLIKATRKKLLLSMNELASFIKPTPLSSKFALLFQDNETLPGFKKHYGSTFLSYVSLRLLLEESFGVDSVMKRSPAQNNS